MSTIQFIQKKSVKEIEHKWANEASKFIDLNGQKVHLRDEGSRDAPVLVLIHGTSASLHVWDEWADILSKSFRVIRFDLPGFGLTGKWTGAFKFDEYSGANFAEFCSQLLEKLGVEKFSIAGNSLGGEIAWRIAASHPKCVEKLILIDAAGYDTPNAQLPFLWKIATWPLSGVIGQILPIPRAMFVKDLKLVMGDNSKITDEFIERYADLSMLPGNVSALSSRMRSRTAKATVDFVRGVVAPTLIMWGQKDKLIPVDLANKFLHDIKNSKLIVYEDLGHIPHEEDGARTAIDAQKFLSSS